jgi:DNA-binding PucR family transcriptional regulator
VVLGLAQATTSAQAALSGLRVASAWPAAPRPVSARALLGERALAGEQAARDELVETVYEPLVAAGGELLETAAAYIEGAGSIDGAARLLFVHANTVRYRLRRVAELTGLSATDPRDGFLLHVALVQGRLRSAVGL